MGKAVIQCVRCHRLQDLERAAAEGWSTVYENDQIVGLECPDCRIAGEETEAAAGEDRGRPVSNPAGADACVICGRPTDTGLGFTGEAELIIAALAELGVSRDRVAAMVGTGVGSASAAMPSGEVCLIFRVCADCSVKVGNPDLQVGPVSSPERLPNYRLMGLRPDEL